MTSHQTIVDAAFVVAGANALVAAWGALRWWRDPAGRGFWIALRAGQVVAGIFGIAAAALWLAGHRASQELFYLYALLPIAIGLVAEQLRIATADQVLAARDLDGARAMAALGDEEQRSIVIEIMRREIGVMALAALVVCFLALRAAATAQGI